MPFWKKAVPKTVPAWCSVLGPADFEQFRKLLKAELSRYAAVTDADIDVGRVTRPNGEVIGLTTIAEILAQAPRSGWSSSIRDWVESLAAAPPSLSDRELRDRFRLRLIAPGAYATYDASGIMVAEDLKACYVIDYPESVTVATGDQLAKLGSHDDEWIALGRRNIAREDVGDPELMELGGTVLTVFSGESFFVASQLLRLGELFAVPQAGVFAIVPTVHQLCVTPITLAALTKALPILTGYARKGFAAGPHPCSPSVYWWTPDRIERLDVELDEASSKFGFTPSDRMMEQLNALTA